MKNISPLISIITPTYFSEKYIEDCILSVLHQSYDNWEMLIIDGKSTDETGKIVKKYSRNDKRIKLINNIEDDGPAQARAFGIEKAKGEYIAFIDSDDMWSPEKLELQLKFMIENTYSFTFTRYRLMDKNGLKSLASIGGYNSNTYSQYLRRRGIANSSVMLKRECINNDILEAISSAHAEDTLWWLLIMKNGHYAFAFQKDLMIYRVLGNSRSSQVFKNQLAVWSMYRDILGLNIFYASFNHFFYLIDVSFRRLKFLYFNMKMNSKI
jgi:teichuronic acid biosynthesis glycosyltransferase TuaG